MDVSTRRVTLETPGAAGRPANGESVNPDISRDGRYVVFESIAGNLTDVELVRGIPRVFLRDRHTGVTRLLSTNASGEPANGLSMNPAISADGDTVVFASSAGDLLEDASTHRWQHGRVPDATRIEGAHTSGRDEPGTGACRPERVPRGQWRRPVCGLHVESRSDVPLTRPVVPMTRMMRRTETGCSTSTSTTRSCGTPDASARVTRDATPTARAITRPSAATGVLSRSCPRRPI